MVRPSRIPEHAATLREWVDTWSRAGPALRAVRERELREATTVRAIVALAGAFASAREHLEPRRTSGLVEQQRLLLLLRR